MSGSVNFRDLGGYTTADGRAVRWGRVYRSGTLAEIDESGIVQIEKLGIETVFDLRSAEERTAAASRLPSSVTTLHVPIKDPSRFGRLRILQVLLFRRNHLADVLFDAYTRVMLDGNGKVLGSILSDIADSSAPVLIHCTAGKDRTGLTSALLLELLGVPRESIVGDYALSARFEAQIARRLDGDLRVLRKLRLTEAQIAPLLTATPNTIRNALAYLDDKYDSVESYVLQQCGVHVATLDKLRSRLLTDVQ